MFTVLLCYAAQLKLRLHVRAGSGQTRDHRGTQRLHGARGTQWARWTQVPLARLRSRVTRAMGTRLPLDVRV